MQNRVPFCKRCKSLYKFIISCSSKIFHTVLAKSPTNQRTKNWSCFLYRKVHISVKTPPLQQLGFFVNLCPVTEGSKGHPAFLCCCRPGDFSHFPTLVNGMEILRQRFGWPPKPNALGFCRCDSLSLPLPDVGALVLCHKRQYLQHNVTEESSQ